VHAGLKPVHDATFVPLGHVVPNDVQRHSVSVLQQRSPSHVVDSPPTLPQEHELRTP
jgi:hypothetical protein